MSKNLIKYFAWDFLSFLIFVLGAFIPVFFILKFIPDTFYISRILSYLWFMFFALYLFPRINKYNKAGDIYKLLSLNEKKTLFVSLCIFLLFALVYSIYRLNYFILIVIILSSLLLLPKEYKKLKEVANEQIS